MPKQTNGEVVSLALKKTCSCGKLIPFELPCCEVCQARRVQEQAARHKHYDKHLRNKEVSAFYNSLEWQKVRATIMRKYIGLDLYGYYVDHQIIFADAVHHIVELRDDWHQRLDINNLLLLTSSNHSKIHKLYQKDIKSTQQLLFDLLRRWEKGFEAQGVPKKF